MALLQCFSLRCWSKSSRVRYEAMAGERSSKKPLEASLEPFYVRPQGELGGVEAGGGRKKSTSVDMGIASGCGGSFWIPFKPTAQKRSIKKDTPT